MSEYSKKSLNHKIIPVPILQLPCEHPLVFTNSSMIFSCNQGSMACEDAGEIATNLWYSQAKNYSYSDPRLNADTDTFTQVRRGFRLSFERLVDLF